MTSLQLDLTEEQRQWLKRLHRRHDGAVAMPEDIADALAEKHLLHWRRGAIEITFVGIAEMVCRQA